MVKEKFLLVFHGFWWISLAFSRIHVCVLLPSLFLLCFSFSVHEIHFRYIPGKSFLFFFSSFVVVSSCFSFLNRLVICVVVKQKFLLIFDGFSWWKLGDFSCERYFFFLVNFYDMVFAWWWRRMWALSLIFKIRAVFFFFLIWLNMVVVI